MQVQKLYVTGESQPVGRGPHPLKIMKHGEEYLRQFGKLSRVVSMLDECKEPADMEL
jgi:hypothetical protein